MSNSKFRDIADIIEKRIVSGDYPPNTKLPTQRILADELSTTPVTVAKAYKLLADKGQLESFVGRGTFVCGHSELNQAIQAPKDEENTYNFSLLQPCLYKNVPALQQAYRQTAELLTPALIGYAENSGHESHRLAGVAWAKKYGLKGGHSGNTLLTNGAQHALSLLIETLSKPGDTIAVESLTYPGILAIASLSGRSVVGIEMDHHGACPNALENVIKTHKPTLVVLVPSHQNPTGISMPESRKRAIANVINRHKTWLVEDDIYCFLDEQPIEPIANFAPDFTFHISALSKALSPAMRCGYIKVPDNKVELLNAHIRANIWLSSPMNYAAGTILIESGEAFRMAEVQRVTAAERQILARNTLASLDESVSSGYHIWLPLPQQWQPERFSMEAKNRGIIVTSGSYFVANGGASNHVRLSLMAISSERRLESGLQALDALMNLDVKTLFPY